MRVLPIPRQALFAVAMLLPVSVFAVNLSVTEIADAFVSAQNPSSNYGAAGALAVSSASTGKGELDSVLKFDFSGIKSSLDLTYGAGAWTINSMTLTLTTASPNNSLFNNPNVIGAFNIKWMQNDSWSEGNGDPKPTADTTGVGITYSGSTGLSNYLSAADETLKATPFASFGGTSGAHDFPLTLTSGFLADATGGNPVSLLLLPADTQVSYVVNSLNNTTATNRPVLTVSATPEPGSSILLAVAGVCLLAGTRRHARAA